MSGAVKQKHHYWPNLKYLFLGRSQFNCLLDKCNPAKEPGEQWATGEAIPDHSSQVRNLVLTGWVTLDKTLDLFILQFSFLQNGNKTCLYLLHCAQIREKMWKFFENLSVFQVEKLTPVGFLNYSRTLSPAYLLPAFPSQHCLIKK